MGTVRVDRTSGAPTTQYTTEADFVSQDQAGNYSTVYIWLRAVNRGTSSSFSNNAGSQHGLIDGVADAAHSSTMPSGVAANGQRWYDGPFGYNIGHDANGNLGAISIHQAIYGWFSGSAGTLYFNDYGTIAAPPRIPKPPTQPGDPVASNILPTTMTLTWTASADNMGSAIDFYLVRRWDTIDGSGTYTDVNVPTGLTYNATGLTPGHPYSWKIYAHNGSAGQYSTPSNLLVTSTLAPSRLKVGGAYKYGIPYIKVAGVYKIAIPSIKVSGAYKKPA